MENSLTEREKKLIQASKLLLIAVSNGDLDVYEGQSGVDYIQILEDATKGYQPEEYIPHIKKATE